MKMLFIIPPFLSVGKKSTHSPHLIPNLGIAYMASILKNEGHEVNVIDALAEGLSRASLINKIAVVQPDIVGLTASTYQIYDAAEIAKEVKGLSSEIITIIGGYHASALPEQTLKEFDSFDYLVSGEGELTLPELLKAISSGNNDMLKDIKGIVYRIGNKIIVNPQRPYIDVNTLPMPDFDEFNLSLYKPFYTFLIRKLRELPVMTSRGCPYDCVFCFRSQGHIVRYKSLQSVIDEIKRDIEVYHINQILFTDETFTINMKRTEAICDALISTGINKKIEWGCETRADVVDEALLKKMKRAGCRVIYYGVESGDQGILDHATKDLKIDDIKNAVKWTKDAGIDVYANLIIGLPYDTEETINRTIDFAIELDPDAVSFAILTPFPGTELVDMIKKGKGELKIIAHDWRDYNKQFGRALELEYLSIKQLRKLQRKAYIKFYFRPKRFINMFKIVDIRALISYFLHRL